MDEQRQTTEVRSTEVQDGATSVQRQTVATRNDATVDSRVIAKRIIWYIAGFIIVLLLIRLVLLMLGANRDSGFVDFVYAVSGVFAAPFAGIFETPSYGGQFFFDTASAVAIAVYSLVAWGVSKLFTLSAPRTDV